jgi:hypothetical protein
MVGLKAQDGEVAQQHCAQCWQASASCSTISVAIAQKEETAFTPASGLDDVWDGYH